MSDTIPYAVGTIKGRDHLQWPTCTLAQLAALRAGNGNTGYIRYGGCNLASIMALAWRIKRFTFSGDAALRTTNVTVGGSGAFTQTTVVDYSFSIPPNQYVQLYGYNDLGTVILATRERDLISISNRSESLGATGGFTGLRNAGFGLATGGIFSPPPPRVFADVTYHLVQTSVPPSIPPITTIDATVPILFQLGVGIFGNSTDAEYVAYDSGLFYPRVDCGGLLFIHAFILFTVDSAGSNGTLTINPVVAPSFTLPLKIAGAFSNSGVNTLNSAAINLTMTADEFWPYKNSAGAPVYSSVSGAQLTDPLG